MGWGYRELLNKAAFEANKEFEKSAELIKKIHFIHWESFPRVIIEDFHKEYPHVHVEFERLDKEDYSILLKARIASESGVDIMGIMENDYVDFVTKGQLVDLNLTKLDYLNNYNDDVRKAVRELTLQKREYAVSYKSWIYGVWYNKTLFSKYNLKVPENYPEFLKVCEELKKQGIPPLVLGARDAWHGSYLHLLRLPKLSYLYPEWFRKVKLGQMEWTDPKIRLAMEEINKFISDGYLHEDSIYLTYHQAFMEFASGKAAMTIMSDLSLNLVHNDIEKVMDPGVFPIPFNDQSTTFVVPGNQAGYLLGILSKSNHKEEAELFLEYLCRPDVAQKYSDITMSVSNINGVDAHIKYDELWKPFRQRPQIPLTIDAMDLPILQQMHMGTKALIMNTKTPQQMLEDLESLKK